MKYGVQLYSLRAFIKENGLENALRVVKECGYDGVELAGFYDYKPKELADLIKKSGLEVISVHMPLKSIETGYAYYTALGIKDVVISYVPPEEFIDYVELKKRIGSAIRAVERRGLNVIYHNHAHELSTGVDYLSQLKDDFPSLGFELDIFWIKAAGNDVLSTMRKFSDRLKLLHLKELSPLGVKAFNPVFGLGESGIANAAELAKRLGVEWLILEAEHIYGSEKEYISACLEKLKL